MVFQSTFIIILVVLAITFMISFTIYKIISYLNTSAISQLEQKNLLEKIFIEQKNELKHENLAIQTKITNELEQHFSKIKEQILQHLCAFNNETHQHQMNNIKYLSDTLTNTLKNYSTEMAKNFEKLTLTAELKLQEISNQVTKRLTEGFEKTNETFIDIVKRLALIDNAQQKLAELSSNIISLQDILGDKRSRGAFGEVQLKNLIENMLPQNNYALQYTLKNNNRADCILYLPHPTGNIIIDAKFPLENFYILTNLESSSADKLKAQQNFKTDIKRHISSIAEKYIIPGETTDAAIMFLPAEAVFAEIHRNFTELVDFSHKNRVFIASPTTMMAILTTASAVIKDSETRKHVHVIKENLQVLAKDFERFEIRMQKLTDHIEKAHENATSVNTSAKKIVARFKKIDKVTVIDAPSGDITSIDQDSVTASDSEAINSDIPSNA